MGLIYLATNKNNGSVYVGKTLQEFKRRIYNHWAEMRRGSQSFFHNALRKHGLDAFTWEILEIVPDDLAGPIEMGWIGLYRAMGYRLYNQTDGGDGCSGARPSEETKLKIGVGNKGKIISIEARARVADANRVRVHTKESKAKHALTSSGGKVYTLVSPGGTHYTDIVNFKGFCREHGIVSRSMWRAIEQGRKLERGTAKGWFGWLQDRTCD